MYVDESHSINNLRI